MQTNRISVIDLGTNTFNLLVAEYSEEGTFDILHRSKYPTKIGKGGINQNTITDEAIQRAKSAFDEMTLISNELQANNRIAFATSAIRSATNGDDFVKMLEDKYHVTIEIISGDREADLIYSGTKHAVELNHEKVAILDIGGGSNEIIIANNEGIFWKKSYPLGMTRLLEKFMPSEPILKEEIKQVEEYLKEQLKDLYEALEVHSVKTLIGSSGSFDTFKQVLLAEKININGEETSTQFEIKLKDFFRLHQIFLGTTLAERKEIPGMDPVRVELIVIASIFINHLVKEAGFSKLYQSSFALKEGALFEHIDNIINPAVNETVEVKE
jgi:exopolyphosphatase/guanosine-5'-triphosphate,3'-diphosphate pyrophosphatase